MSTSLKEQISAKIKYYQEYLEQTRSVKRQTEQELSEKNKDIDALEKQINRLSSHMQSWQQALGALYAEEANNASK